MPAKTAGKKLLFPAICVLAALLALSAATLLHRGSIMFIELEHSAAAAFPLGEGFALACAGSVSAYSGEGELLFLEKLPVSADQCVSDGETLAILSGESVRLYSEEGFLGAIEGEARVNCLALGGGVLAVARESAYYGCAVTFYSGTEPLFCRYIAKGSCVAAALDGRDICLALDSGELLFLSGAELRSRISATAVHTLYSLGGVFCAVSHDKISFFTPAGEKTGEYSGKFTLARPFDDVLCAITPEGASVLNTKGENAFSYALPAGVPVFLGQGAAPALILGEKVSVFNKKMELQYTIENKFVPENVITKKDTAVLLWQRAAEIHRK